MTKKDMSVQVAAAIATACKLSDATKEMLAADMMWRLKKQTLKTLAEELGIAPTDKK